MTEQPTDLELLRRVSRQDERAFDELYHRHSTSLYTYLLRLVHKSTVAEDLLQEVFVAAWKGAGEFRGQAKVKTWLFRIAHNQAVSWLRHRREILTPEGELPDMPVPSIGETQVVESWRVECLRTALDRLSPDHRAVLELAFFYELSYAEIAEVMACPLGTVKSRMSYARRYLSEMLVEMGLGEVEVDEA
jgi:RNA polymerase sigma-70 factor (ECF subfamily)